MLKRKRAMAGKPQPRSRRLLWAGLAAAALLALGLYASYGIEWVEQEVDLGYGEEATRNHYLAAELFLREQGSEVETVEGMAILESLPPPGDTLVITTTRRGLSERRVERLARWLETGGHLVVVAREHYDEETGKSLDPLLTRYGVHLLHPEPEEEEEAGDDAEGELTSAAAEGETGSEELAEEDGEQRVGDILADALSGELSECWDEGADLALFQSPEGAGALELELSGRHHLAHASGGRASEALAESGAQLVHLPIGEGWLTAATSLSIWKNRRIHCHDHAYLLWLLTQPAGKVWLLHDPEIPSLLALLGTAFPLTCAGAVALLLLWATAQSLRFGPMLPGAEGERRELLEHLEASAHFLWRRELLADALDALREEITQRAALQHGAWPRLNAAGRMGHLAELAELPPQDVHAALTLTPPLRRRELVHTMQTLQAIRRKL
jgi:hypothetical protein